MTNEEKLLMTLGVSTSYSDFPIIAVRQFADDIRRECADIAETIVSESLYDGAGYYQVDIPFMKAAIIGNQNPSESAL